MESLNGKKGKMGGNASHLQGENLKKGYRAPATRLGNLRGCIVKSPNFLTVIWERYHGKDWKGASIARGV